MITYALLFLFNFLFLVVDFLNFSDIDSATPCFILFFLVLSAFFIFTIPPFAFSDNLTFAQSSSLPPIAYLYNYIYIYIFYINK